MSDRDLIAIGFVADDAGIADKQRIPRKPF
jgi:hypothetical protein